MLRGYTHILPFAAAMQLLKVLQLDSATLSPLLKRLESSGLVLRQRRGDDERNVDVVSARWWELDDVGRWWERVDVGHRGVTAASQSSYKVFLSQPFFVPLSVSSSQERREFVLSLSRSLAFR